MRFEWYTQDQWQATKKLLLDYGVRYSWAMAQKLSAGNNFAPRFTIQRMRRFCISR